MLTVCGCAGSGKTMIMFHRLRYLLYNNPDLDAKCAFLISPINLLLQVSDELSQTLQLSNATITLRRISSMNMLSLPT